MIKVVAALIKRDNKYLLARRSSGDPNVFGKWEFPGGKNESGETPQEALKREILEELDTEIAVGDLIDTIEFDYPDFHLSMECFWCEIYRGDLVLKEHEAARWLNKESLCYVNWLPADVLLLEKVQMNL